MAVVRLPGINKVRKRLADGTVQTIYYAWNGKGAPRLEGRPGSPEFVVSYNRAVADRRALTRTDNLAALVGRYKSAPDFGSLADTTRAEWMRWLDQICLDRDGTVGVLDIGGLPLKALDDRRVRADLLDWRNQWADRPRSADYAMQVLSRVLAFGVDRGELSINVAAGVSQLYESKRARFSATAPSAEASFAVEPAALTCLRLSDLVHVAEPRLLTAAEAAAYFRLPVKAFERLRVGRVCLGARVLYDRIALDAHLDDIAGLAPQSGPVADNDAEAALDRFTLNRSHASRRS